jgi:thiol-disulfide isomerase/thioredoxin
LRNSITRTRKCGMLQKHSRMVLFVGLLALVGLGALLMPLPVWQSVMARLGGSSAQQAVSGLEARTPATAPRTPGVTPLVFALRLKEGDKAPPFSLKDTQGKTVRLEDLPHDMPMVIEFGSRTCDPCMGQVEPMNNLARRYQGKAKFVFIYSREAHPDPARVSQSEDDEHFPDEPARAARMRHRQEAAQSFCSIASKDWLVLVDEVAEKSVYHTYVQGLGNPLFVVGRDGRIVLAMEWTNAEELEALLKRFLVRRG